MINTVLNNPAGTFENRFNLNDVSGLNSALEGISPSKGAGPKPARFNPGT